MNAEIFENANQSENESEELAAEIRDRAVFALDVGTRTIVGVVGVWEQGYFRVLAAEPYDHKNRVMFDGQIHDIREVAAEVSELRSALEKRAGFPLESVYIAAAGRTLKTFTVAAQRDITPGVAIDEKLLKSLETEALRSAHETALNGSDASGDGFDYVGHSVTNKYLDGYPISNLLGHIGKNIKIELLVTFLPRVVVNSLFSVMRELKLVVAGLTLEPIAALDAVVPDDVRHMNLALVDIGAGTSDIAITKNGGVCAYSMVTYAGDRVTERICDRYLTDYKTGEAIKHAVYANAPEIAFRDIFGRKSVVGREEACEVMLPAVRELAKRVAEDIIAKNGKPPVAAIVIGGGCKLPDFESHFAEALGIDADRVAIRNRDAIPNIIFDSCILTGPEAVTPFGIAVGSAGKDGFHPDLMSVRLNARPVRLPDYREYSVAEVLEAASFDFSRLDTKQGNGVNFYYNGNYTTVPGESGRPARIEVNGAEAGLETIIGFNCDVSVFDAADGGDARVYVGDLSPRIRVGTVVCEGAEYYIAPRAAINGVECALSSEVREGDHVELETGYAVKRLAEEYYRGASEGSDADAHTVPRIMYTVNGTVVDGDYELTPGDEIMFSRLNNAEPAGPESIEADAATDAAANAAADAATDTATDAATVALEVNGLTMEIPVNTKELLMVDILNHINIESSDGSGRLSLKINNASAKLTERVNTGDRLAAEWVFD